jgi:sugar O-acyltransferase (sialic acid O-acetyltransferase NeuD family)
MNNMSKLVMLGFNAGTIPIIAEMAFEIYGIKSFDIVKNIDVSETKRQYVFSEFDVRVFFDYQYDKCSYDNHPVHFGSLNAHIKYILFHHFNKVANVDKNQYLTLIHPTSHISMSVKNGNGCLIEPVCAVSTFTDIGFGVTIKRGSTIGHHNMIGDYANINPGVNISGNVSIGEGTEIGTGSSVVNNVSIGKHCLIGAGSVVTRDIPDGVVAYGNPCKVIRPNERWERALKVSQSV